MTEKNDPMGSAIADYWKHGVAGRLRVFSPDFDEDEIPVETLFRTLEEMPTLEQEALRQAQGRILDVGAGAGCHTLALQEMGKDVTAIDISPLSVQTMREQGVERVVEQDFFALEGTYDTILMLMNGIGIVGTISRLPKLFRQWQRLLAPGGQVLLDSSDISYVFENEDGMLELPEGEAYYGELQYQMQYKKVKGDPFDWLYVDAQTLCQEAQKYGFRAEVVMEGDHYDYLAKVTRMEK